MQLKSFVIPLADSLAAEEELNRFLRGHRVLQVSRQFSAEGGGYWAVLVEYIDNGKNSDELPAPVSRSEKKDYSKELSPKEYEEFQRLREIRKEVARQRSLPAYAIFTNEELAVLSRQPALTIELQKGVKGISDSHLNDYLTYFLPVLTDETSGEPDGADCSSGKLT